MQMILRASIAAALFVPSLLLAQADSEQSAAAAYERKDYAACAAIYSRLGRQSKQALQLYDAATCYALAGDRDNAFAMLGEALDAGWPNTKLLREDADLESLRGDEARWKAVMARAEANWAKKFGADNRELWAMREADESDGRTAKAGDAAALERYHARTARTKEIIAAGGLKTPTDYFNAAMLMHHGKDPDDFRRGHELAVRASELDPSNGRARWLVAATQDRYLRSLGKPQIYGTQMLQVDGVWQLYTIDETAVTDEERARFNVPPLAEQKKRAAAMNRK